MINEYFTDITSGIDARAKIIEGVNKGVDVVASTFGYRGRTVMTSNKGLPEPTKDGFEVAQSIFLKDKVESHAWESCKEASNKTVLEAGDSTTLTMVLLQAFLKYSYEALDNGESPIDIKLKIEKSRDLVIDYLNELSIPLDDKMMYDVAKTSANGDDEIANLVYNAFKDAGENGSVGHIRSNNDKTFVDVTSGTLVERGFADERYVNVVSSQSIVFDDSPLVLISDISFQTITQIVPFLEFAIKQNKQIVIISEMDFTVENTILSNKLKHNHQFALIKAPAIGKKREELLMDLALICDTEMVSTMSGHDFIGRETQFLGVAKSVTITKENTIIVKHDSVSDDKIFAKIEELKGLVKLTDKNFTLKSNLENRIAKLSGKVSMIKVGGITPSEVKEKIDRVDDAICAVRSSKEKGVLAGGGVALLSAIKNVSNLDAVTSKVLSEPFSKLLANASVKEAVLLENYPEGYNLKSFQKENMFEAGIIDANKAICCAFENAVSTSNVLLMTDNVLTINK